MNALDLHAHSPSGLLAFALRGNKENVRKIRRFPYKSKLLVAREDKAPLLLVVKFEITNRLPLTLEKRLSYRYAITYANTWENTVPNRYADETIMFPIFKPVGGNRLS